MHAHGDNLVIKDNDILLGFRSKSVYQLQINFALLYAKWFVVIKKMAKKEVIFAAYKSFLKEKLSIHIFIAKRQGNYDQERKLTMLQEII